MAYGTAEVTAVVRIGTKIAVACAGLTALMMECRANSQVTREDAEMLAQAQLRQAELRTAFAGVEVLDSEAEAHLILGLSRAFGGILEATRPRAEEIRHAC
jgi:hypothetical protein